MDALGEHSCNDRCPCKRYGKLDKTKHPIISAKIIEMCPKEALEEHVDRLGDETWLAAHVEEGHSFAIGCIVCSELPPLGDRDVWGRFEITTVQALKPYRVKSHESSKAHLAAVMRLLQPSADLPAQMPLRHDAAPDGNSFQCLLQWVRKGQCLRDGVAGVGHFKKSRSMCFVLTESLRRLYRAQLSKCETINILRDERHSRQAERFIGVLGQGRVNPSTATNITNVTVGLLTAFCCKNHGVPNVSEAVATELQEVDVELLKHIRHRIHYLTVDAAGNEVTSGENMLSNKSSTAANFGEAVAPNLRTIVKDKAHGSRRILSRPWAADKYLSVVAGALVTESGSLSQMIQHSDDLRCWYEEACKQSTSGAVTNKWTHLRAAKHRYESLATPLSRLALNWEAVFGVLGRICAERQGDPACSFAEALLDTIDEEMLLQAALLSDACDECLILIRFFDQAEVDSAKIAEAISDFLSRIQFLFEQQHVWTSPGYTKVTLKFLQSPTHFITRGVVRCLGGPNGVKEEVKSQCLSRMLAWMKLAEEVVRAEHPAFELVPCFSLFDLNQFPQQTAARIKQEDLSQHSLSALQTAWSLTCRGLSKNSLTLVK
ncbi:Uncharacterized protein SCF082_LOCUS46783 [Durusdinium trenchii]|uniref:Uncharacterized protein n=1 Tax=Durusdinium trenchii TaxID=1381693 RepID=A0ABP0RH50_9DINO